MDVRVVMFYHSIASDWNHGNAHFLRGVAAELHARGHRVTVWEPRDAWSATNLAADAGPAALDGWLTAHPQLASARCVYDPATLDLDAALADAELVLVHEWSDHALVARLGAHRARAGGPARGGYRLLFHDTHHRAVTERAGMAAYDLRHFDGALVFGDALAAVYRDEGWVERVWTWHEAADVRLFRPHAGERRAGDLVWVGNWGDDERTAELREFLVEPVRDLRLRAHVHGVRYPASALATLADAGIAYRGWLPNHLVPLAFARHAVTVHVPRRPYVRALPGIPTIRVFEALACGIPLVSAPWDDAEGLFSPGADYLVARDGREMRRHLGTVLGDPAAAHALAAHGRATVLARHTCAHRVDELLAIARALGVGVAGRSTPEARCSPLLARSPDVAGHTAHPHVA